MTTAVNRSVRKSAGGLRRSEWKWGYLFIGLNLLAFLVFSLGPILASLAMSFMNWSILRPPEFVGLANVERLLDDDLFFTTLGNTLFFAVSNVFLVTVFSFIIAVLLNQPIRGRTLFRTAFFLPSITLVVSVAMIWQWILNPQGGLLNYVLQLLRVPQPQWLADRQLAMPTLIAISVWQNLGYYAVVYLAGLQGIPNEYYEAAQIDGATGLQRTLQITVPLIAPTTFFVIVTSLIASWQVFELPYLLTAGGPANATRTLQMYIYSQAFGSFRMGYASLISWVMFLLILIVTIAQWTLARRRDSVVEM
jgi:multiple sugar transport system permease protein